MATKKEYAECSKLSECTTDWKCPCCNPFNKSPRKMKAEAHRMLRRVTKQKQKKDETDLSI